MKNTILFSSICIILLASCGKSNDPTPALTPTEILTSGKWQLTAYIYTYSFGTTTYTSDYYANMYSYVKDNYTIYEANGNVTIDEGPTKYISTNPQTYSGGTWLLGANNTQLVLTSGVTTNISAINELTNDEMKIEFDSVNTMFTTKAIQTYKHIK